MIKIVSGPADLRGFDICHFYTVYSACDDSFELVALASSKQEALDAQEMIADLRGGRFHISPPKSETN